MFQIEGDVGLTIAHLVSLLYDFAVFVANIPFCDAIRIRDDDMTHRVNTPLPLKTHCEHNSMSFVCCPSAFHSVDILCVARGDCIVFIVSLCSFITIKYLCKNYGCELWLKCERTIGSFVSDGSLSCVCVCELWATSLCL